MQAHIRPKADTSLIAQPEPSPPEICQIQAAHLVNRAGPFITCSGFLSLIRANELLNFELYLFGLGRALCFYHFPSATQILDPGQTWMLKTKVEQGPSGLGLGQAQAGPAHEHR